MSYAGSHRLYNSLYNDDEKSWEAIRRDTKYATQICHKIGKDTIYCGIMKDVYFFS